MKVYYHRSHSEMISLLLWVSVFVSGQGQEATEISTQSTTRSFRKSDRRISSGSVNDDHNKPTTTTTTSITTGHRQLQQFNGDGDDDDDSNCDQQEEESFETYFLIDLVGFPSQFFFDDSSSSSNSNNSSSQLLSDRFVQAFNEIAADIDDDDNNSNNNNTTTSSSSSSCINLTTAEIVTTRSSQLSSSSSSSSPTADTTTTTTTSDERDFSLLMKVTGICVGCEEGSSILKRSQSSSSTTTSPESTTTSSINTRRITQESNTTTTNTTSSPPTSSPTFSATTESTVAYCPICEDLPTRNRVLASWFRLLPTSKLNSITGILDITELFFFQDQEPTTTCHPSNFTRFNTNVVITFNQSIPTTATQLSSSNLNDVSTLNDMSIIFDESYMAINELNSDLCDPFFRQLLHVSTPSIVDDTSLYANIIDGGNNNNDDQESSSSGSSSLIYMTFEVEGICQGCNTFGGHLFGDDKSITSTSTTTEAAGASSSNGERKLQTEEGNTNSTLCLCPSNVDQISPTESQFLVKFVEAIQDLEGFGATATNTTVDVIDVVEVDSLECSDDVVQFTEIVLLDININNDCQNNSSNNSSSSILPLLDDDYIETIEETFVAAYNELAETFCDPKLRIIDTATLLRQRPNDNNNNNNNNNSISSSSSETTTTTVTLEMNVIGRCRGCNPNDVSIYASFAEIFPIGDALKAAIDSEEQHLSTRRKTNVDSTTRRQRRLATCYCDTSATTKPRAPTEQEFIVFLSRSLPAGTSTTAAATRTSSSSSCVSSIVQCDFGSPFQTAIVASFEANNGTDLTTYSSSMEAAFLRSIGSFYRNTPTWCNPEFRKFQSVDSIISVPFQPRDFGLPVDRRRMLMTKTNSIEQERELQQGVGGADGPSESPSMAPTSTPTTSMPSGMPSSSPSSAPTFIDTDTYVLFYFNGVCNGCEGLPVITSTSIVQAPPDDDGGGSDTSTTVESNSECYCPIDAEEINGPYEATSLEAVFQNELSAVENVPFTVRNLYEMDVVECQGAMRNFDSLLYINFSFNGTMTQNEQRMLSRLVRVTYRRLSNQYCDPLRRRLISLTLQRGVRLDDDDNGNSTTCSEFQLRYSASGICQGCENGASLLDESIEDRRRGLIQEEPERPLFSENAIDAQRNLRFQRDELCFCDQGTIASRPPNLQEFESALNEALSRSPFGKVCTVSVPSQVIETSSPTAAPTEEVCNVTLPDQISSRVLVTLQNPNHENLSDAQKQGMGDTILTTYNSMIELQYTPCDLEYQLVSNVTVDTEFAAPSDSLPFIVEVDCQGCGQDSDLFEPNVITRSGFQALYKRNVQEGNFSIASVREIDLRTCPSDTSEFSRVVRIEFTQLPCMEGLNFTGTEPQMRSIEAAFVSAYNNLVLSYCDPFYRKLEQAEIVRFGENTEEGNLPVEIRVNGICRGCNPDMIDVYAIPNSESEARRQLQDPMQTTGLLHRSLQDVEICFCDSQAIGDRAPFEAEFITAYRKAVEALNLECIESVGQCSFGTRFATGIVVDFEESELLESGNVTELIEETFQEILNDLYEVDEETCNPEFRVVESVKAQIGVNITTGSQNTTGESSERMLQITVFPTTSPTTSPAISNATDATDSPEFFPGGPTSSPTIAAAFSPSPISSISVLLFITGTCNGCENDLSLSNQVTSTRTRQRKERELNDGSFNSTSNCFCPIEATRQVAVDADEVTASYQIALNEEVNLTVNEIEEVLVVECIDEERRFENEFTLTFAVTEDITNREIYDLADLIAHTYNDLNEAYCDPYERRIDDLRFNEDSRVRRRRMQEGNCANLDIEFNGFGKCRGCEDDIDLFDDDDDDRRQRRGLSDFILDPSSVGRGRRRWLQEGDVCVCDPDAIALRAPTFDEFVLVFEPRLEALQLSNVCGFYEVETSEASSRASCDVTRSGDDFSSSVQVSVVVEGDIHEGHISDMEEVFFDTFNHRIASSMDTCDEEYAQLYFVTVHEVYDVSRRLADQDGKGDDETKHRLLQGFQYLNVVFDFFGFCQVDGQCDGGVISLAIGDISNAFESRIGPVVAAGASEEVFASFETEFIQTFTPSFGNSYIGTYNPEYTGPPEQYYPYSSEMPIGEYEDYTYYYYPYGEYEEGTEYPFGYNEGTHSETPHYDYEDGGTYQPLPYEDYTYYGSEMPYSSGEAGGPTFEPEYPYSDGGANGGTNYPHYETFGPESAPFPGPTPFPYDSTLEPYAGGPTFEPYEAMGPTYEPTPEPTPFTIVTPSPIETPEPFFETPEPFFETPEPFVETPEPTPEPTPFETPEPFFFETPGPEPFFGGPTFEPAF